MFWLKKYTVLILLNFVFLLLICQTFAEAPQTALLKIDNYSGVDTLGGNKITTMVDKSFDKLMEKIAYLDYDKTKDKLQKSKLDGYYQTSNLCNSQDLFRLGKKMGITNLVILEVNGYNEIKREGSGKNYQFLLGLKVYNCESGEEFSYNGEGIDSNRDKALNGAVTQLVNRYLNLETSDLNSGNIRSQSATVIGHAKSLYYHLPTCHHLPATDDRINIETRAQAEENDFRPCPICFPSLKSYSYYDRDIEETLGSEACGNLEYYYRVYHDQASLERIKKIADPLIKDSIRKNIDYRFQLLDTDIINAYASPNGYLYLTKGLIEIAESDDELAFVIAHEMGHVEKKHAVIMYKQALALAVFGAILVASSKSKDQGENALYFTVISNILTKGYSREQEGEADQVALAHLKRLNKNYRIYQTLMGRFIDMREGKVYGISKLFATHPTPEKRIESLDQALADYEALQAKLAGN